MEWQPIETAPKDHVTIVDLWSNGYRYTNCSWGRPTYSDSGEHCWVQNNSGYDCNGPIDEQVIPYPTYWMPIPDPPE